MAKTSFAQHIEPGWGVLAHITSLPGGRFDNDARRFVDLLAEAGATYWQILPLHPTDVCGSPYAGASAFAGNTALLGCDRGRGRVTSTCGDSHQANAIAGEEPAWLNAYAEFMQQRTGADPEETRREQHEFDRQWQELHAYANERGIKIIGDLPLYVGPDSADVQQRPELFQLDENGKPAVAAGCPPDAFAPEGQIWNNPVYDWDAIAADDYRWWIERLRRAFELYDIVRLDHFIGFVRYYSIPVGQPASEGFYREGPGAEIFWRAHAEFGPLPVIAEDLGTVTDEVRQFVASCGFSGMDVLQFADDPLHFYDPPENAIAYTGTHDNQTLIGYCQSRYPDRDPRETAATLIARVRDCRAAVRIFPLQDLLGLGDEARMNTPGTVGGNWAWQLDKLPETLALY